VLHDAVPIENPVERGERAASIHHEVLGDDLKPVYRRFVFEDVPVVRDT
jgi:hypothetical protein